MDFLVSQVYADYESNPQLRQAIEFACRQFYILHRKPFVLQLFASVAPLLEFPVSVNQLLHENCFHCFLTMLKLQLRYENIYLRIATFWAIH